ncbi:DUF4123 domain-containing protein [Vibrio sp. NH-UV-68]|uniref:DUF4123 domain-containing protein n=1 Tax=unclassified Vibrio TaxID=2614977 RepID=UPI0036F249DE
MISLNEAFIDSGFSFDLSKGERLYLIVDGAQIEGLARTLYALNGPINVEPIYMMPPHDQLLEVSPYIVHATKAIQDWFLAQNKPMSGYFVASAKSLEIICENYRNFIIAESPYGSQLYIKMANSECAWVFYSTHTPQFWNDISQVWIPTRKGWQSAICPDLNRNRDKLKISDEQWSLLGKVSWDTTVIKLKDHVLKWFPLLLDGNVESLSWVETYALSAYKQGFTSERDLMMYMNIIGFLGEDKFLDERLYPDIHDLILNASQQTPSQRVEKAANLAQAYSNHNNNQEKQV